MPIINSYIPDSQLYHDLKSMDRDNFSYEGAQALMEYLEELSEDIGENIEYDPIAFCCDYEEYNESELPELLAQCGLKDMGELEENTTVIHFDGGFIVQAF